MKDNYIVSGYRKAWIKDAERLFIVEPHVYHVLDKNGELKNYETVVVAPYLRKTREDLKRDHDFVDCKYRKYIPLLTQRLNEIHHVDYDQKFWRKSLSLGILRHIVFLYEVFKTSEYYLQLDQHHFQALSQESYYIPESFDDHRRFFQHTHYGQEQIFSIYLHLYYPNQFPVIVDRYHWEKEVQDAVPSDLSRTMRQYLRRIKNQGGAFIREFINKFDFKFSGGPVVGVMCTAVSDENLFQLIRESKGRIQGIPLRTSFDASGGVDWGKRSILSCQNPECDKFDTMFFASLQYCMPRCFIEDYSSITSFYKDCFSKYRNLKFVVSETWIGHSHPSMALAILQDRGIKHIYNEHNYLGHQFLGCNQKYLAQMSDYYLTLGWVDPDFSNLVRGASLFQWTAKENESKTMDILYVHAPATAKREEFNAAYGLNAESAIKYMDLVKEFFSCLSSSTRRRIVFKDYPESLTKEWLVYDNKFVLKGYTDQCKTVSGANKSAKELMLQARLVIIDYQSTAHIEAMQMNVPTVFFWDQDSYYLADKYKDFFAPLISAGICQVNPEEAAKFIEQIIDGPEAWWFQEEVQKKKNEWLRRNFQEPRVMIDYLLGLAKA